MQQLDRVLAWVFGIALLVLAVAVAVETLMRKVLNRSLQGVDELGGYVLALTAALSFAIAIHARTHIRIDLLHDRFPRSVRVFLNVAAVAAIAACAGAAAYMAWLALADTIQFNATAQTPWATPLKYPQAVWLAALLLFLLVALAEIVRIVLLLAKGDMAAVDRRYGPRGAKEELDEELEDLKARGGAAPDGGTAHAKVTRA